jgi:protein-S-isoprenylcysteine O-methyltransferase Ste14
MWFKLAFVFAFIAAASIAAQTARLAGRAHGAPLNQLSHEVRALILIRAALGLVFYAALGAWLFWSKAVAWTYLPIPNAVRWTAVALLIPTLLFFSWSFRSLGSNYRGGVGLHDRHELITTGAYGWMRHPIYAGFIAIMILVTFLSANWVLGAAGLLLVISIAAVRIPIEERQLHDRFGRDWEEYSARAGYFLPRFTK